MPPIHFPLYPMQPLRAARRLTLGALCLWIIASSAPPVSAQENNPTQIIVNYNELRESPESQEVDVYFTVVDADGRAILNPTVSDAQMTLNSQNFTAQVSIPQTPLNLVLILDTSGSMRPAASPMRAAAVDAVNAAPQGTRFAIVQFNATVNTRLGFTDDRSVVIESINTMDDAQFDGGTCLYDATFEALTLAQGAGASGRRAVLLFTDGRDELIAGGELDQCSTRDYDAVIEAARNPQIRVPIYTIGLGGSLQVNTAELESMAISTGGLSAFGETAELSALFQQIIAALASQRLATARVCLAAGEFSGFLQVEAGSTALNAPFPPLTFTTTCVVPTETPTPEPLALTVGDFRFNPASNALEFEVRRTGDGAIGEYRIAITNKNTGFQVEGEYGEFVVDAGDGDATLVQVPLEGISALTWVVEAIALDANGSEIARAFSSEITPSRTETPTSTPPPSATPTATPTPQPTATITPEPLVLTVGDFRFNPGSNALEFEVRRTGVGAVGEYRITITNKNTGFQIDGEYGEFVIDAGDDDATLVRVPITGITTLTWIVQAIALDANGDEIARAFSDEITPPRTETPTLTPAPTFTPTPTPIVSVLNISSIQYDEEGSAFVLNLAMVNMTAANIESYTVRIENANNIQVFQETRNIAPANPLRIAAVDRDNRPLTAGQYTITVETTTGNNALPIRASREVTKPAGPAPTPAPTPIEQFQTNVQTNPVLAGGVVLLVLAILIFLILSILRGRGGRKRGAYDRPVYKPGKSGAFDPEDAPRKRGKIAVAEMTTPILIPGASIPGEKTVVLTLLNAAPGDIPNQVWTITPREVPFRIGRGGSADYKVKIDLRDAAISAHHATIQYANGQYALVDDGSANGTFLDDELLQRGQRYPLENGQVIRLGPITRIGFSDGNGTKSGNAAPAPANIPTPAPPPVPMMPVAPIAAPALPFKSARLTIVQSQDLNKQPGQSFDITVPEYRVGRAAGNDLVIETDGISKEHVVLKWENDGFIITDLQSRNGTTVDGERLPGGGSKRLEAGKEYTVMLGLKTRVQFTYTVPAGSKPGAYNPEATQVELPEPPLRAPVATALSSEATSIVANDPNRLPPNVRAEIGILRGFNVPTGLIEINKTEWKIGRRQDNDLIFETTEISRFHTRLFWRDGQFFIEDMGSGNGTAVDDQPLTANTPQALPPGRDIMIRLGKPFDPALLRFHYTLSGASSLNIASSDDPATTI